MRKKYHSPELRHEAIRQVIELRQSAKAVAEDLQVGHDAVRVWVRRYREERAVVSMSAAIKAKDVLKAAERELLRRQIEMNLLSRVRQPQF